jgi:CBS domain-containing protein
MTIAGLDTVSPDTDVCVVISLMARDHVRRILVTDGGRLVGVIAQADHAPQEGQL